MPSQKPKICSNQIRRYRMKRNMRLREVTRLVGLTSPAHLSHWEKGRKLPKLINALKLSAVIGSPVEILFKGLFDEIRHEVFVQRYGDNQRKENDSL